MIKELKKRHLEACGLRQSVSHEHIIENLSKYRMNLGLDIKPNKYYASFKKFIRDSNNNYIFDASYDAIIAMGAKEKGYQKEWDIFYPIFQAFEAGLWLYYMSEDGIHYLTIPKIYKNAQNQLHRDDGPAIEIEEDGRYYLNGVAVSKNLVMTPAEDLDPKMIFKEKNAEVRREIVRKIGIERIILKCGAKSIDKQGDYELLGFDIGDGNVRPYLKMKNPSIKCYHIEGIAPGIKTVKEALAWRNGTEVEPEILT